MKEKFTFGHWDEAIHSTSEQIKRLDKAKKKETTPDSVDRENTTGVFPGSGKTPYQTTLDSCTCGDFSRRHLPCKHMYRLALECSFINESFSVGENKNIAISKQIQLKDAVAELEIMTDKEQIEFKRFLYLNLYCECSELIIDPLEFPLLISCAFIVSHELNAQEMLECMKKNDIQQIIITSNTTKNIPQKATKATLIAWCIDNIPEIKQYYQPLFKVSFIPEFQSVKRRLYSYLLRKYEWDVYYDCNMQRIEYPHGAKFEDVYISIRVENGEKIKKVSGNPNICHFPNDEITELLTQYGHNRCLNGYLAEPKLD